MQFLYFFLRKLERRFDLLFCTGSANRNSGTANECVLTIGRKLFLFYFLTFRAILCGLAAINDLTSFLYEAYWRKNLRKSAVGKTWFSLRPMYKHKQADTHEGCCSRSVLQGQFPWLVHTGEHSVRACSMLWYTHEGAFSSLFNLPGILLPNM